MKKMLRNTIKTKSFHYLYELKKSTYALSNKSNIIIAQFLIL